MAIWINLLDYLNVDEYIKNQMGSEESNPGFWQF